MLELFARPRRADAEGGGAGARVDAEVTDNEDGTYTAVVVLEEATKHDVHVSVNGLSDSESRYFLTPSLAPLSAAECVVRGVGADRGRTRAAAAWAEPEGGHRPGPLASRRTGDGHTSPT